MIDASSPIGITTEHTPEKFYKKGQGEEYPDELRFSRLELRNSTAGDIQIRLWAGFGKFIDSRIEVLESFTQAFGSSAGVTSLPNADQVDLTGTPNGNQIQRKAVIVSNLDANAVIYVTDADGKYICAVFPLTSITVPVSTDVSIRNDSGGAVAIAYSEIWYVTQE